MRRDLGFDNTSIGSNTRKRKTRGRGRAARCAAFEEREEAGGDVGLEAREVGTFRCECVEKDRGHASAAGARETEGRRELQVERRCFAREREARIF